jgi:uncharacterized protein YkwD
MRSVQVTAAAAFVATCLACWAADPAGADAEACARFDRADVLATVNGARARGGDCGRLGRFEPARPLAWQPDLAEAAQRQARWIAERGELLHLGPRGEALAERTRAAGYAFRRVNENLALGQRSPAEVVGDWLGSEGHCANLLDASIAEFGLATACTASGDKVWVMVAGRR